MNRLAVSATTHCMTGCAIGEVLGLVIATAAAWGVAASIVIALVLAFFFGYSLTMLPLLRAGLPFAKASALALAADTASSHRRVLSRRKHETVEVARFVDETIWTILDCIGRPTGGLARL